MKAFQDDNNELTPQKNKNTAISFMQLSASEIIKEVFPPPPI
jgi:hypothetical protein